MPGGEGVTKDELEYIIPFKNLDDLFNCYSNIFKKSFLLVDESGNILVRSGVIEDYKKALLFNLNKINEEKEKNVSILFKNKEDAIIVLPLFENYKHFATLISGIFDVKDLKKEIRAQLKGKENYFCYADHKEALFEKENDRLLLCILDNMSSIIIDIYKNSTKLKKLEKIEDKLFSWSSRPKSFTTAETCKEGDSFELKIKENLADAIKNEEFVLFYQPVVDMKTGKISSLEALVRWNSPIFGFMPPLKFIPICEKTGLIKPLGNWILNRAMEDGKKICENLEYPMDIAINVSAVQFEGENFVSVVKKNLEETKFDPAHLYIEITESSLILSLDNILNILKELKNMGIRILLDDFGTGYSSLNYLENLPIDGVKIDKSFISKIEEVNYKKSILSSIISLVKKMNLDAIVEGVEEESQLRYLEECSCTKAQGYLFSKPIPITELHTLFDKKIII